MKCPECGTENQPRATSCEFCQYPLGGTPTAPIDQAPPQVARRRAEAEERLRRSRQMERITVPALVVVSLVLLGLLVAFFPKKKLVEKPDFTKEYPVAALNKYFGALKAEDYTTAYSMLAQVVQQKIPEEQFAALFTGGRAPKVTGYSVKDTGDFDETNSYAAVEVNGSPEFVGLAKDPEGWRISWTPLIGDATGTPSPV